jgi:tripartite-type tricarboxylate transporter receptor subunit TctC
MAAGAGFMTMLLGAAQGPTYPSRPITLVVGLAAGSGQGAATAGVRDTHGEIANSK